MGRPRVCRPASASVVTTAFTAGQGGARISRPRGNSVNSTGTVEDEHYMHDWHNRFGKEHEQYQDARRAQEQRLHEMEQQRILQERREYANCQHHLQKQWQQQKQREWEHRQNSTKKMKLRQHQDHINKRCQDRPHLHLHSLPTQAYQNPCQIRNANARENELAHLSSQTRASMIGMTVSVSTSPKAPGAHGRPRPSSAPAVRHPRRPTRKVWSAAEKLIAGINDTDRYSPVQKFQPQRWGIQQQQQQQQQRRSPSPMVEFGMTVQSGLIRPRGKLDGFY